MVNREREIGIENRNGHYLRLTIDDLRVQDSLAQIALNSVWKYSDDAFAFP